MTPDDERHGTPAGWQKHIRDKEQACEPCADARRTYQRKQPHLRALGAKPYIPIGATAHANVLELSDLSDREWGDHTGTSKEVRNRILASSNPSAYMARPHVARKLRQLNPDEIRDALLTHVGAIRRTKALARIGYSGAAIAATAGMHEDAVVALRDGRYQKSSLTTRRKIADAYTRLHMTPLARDRITARTMNLAERSGWHGPLAWEFIDRDPAPKGSNATGVGDLDPVVVRRILAGDWTLRATKAEKRGVVAAWPGTHNELARLTGWKVERYTTPDEGAAA